MKSSLRIHLHDNSGHPFTVQLSRALAARGHQVLHTYMAMFQSPKGTNRHLDTDPATLRIEGLDLGRPFAKYSYFDRWRQERQYGVMLARMLERERPDILLAANTPPEMLYFIQAACRRLGIGFVFWVQDLYGYAMRQILAAKYGVFGEVIGRYYQQKEAALLRAADGVVAITEDFRPFLERAGVRGSRIAVIPNWAPLAELPVRNKENSWAVEHGLDNRFVYLYSGTLGLKHNPELLLALAQSFRDDPAVAVVVVTEGPGADWLHSEMKAADLSNLRLMSFQPFERFPDLLGTADVMVAMLEESAGVFSVPSKILSYLCAARPVLLAAPAANQASKLIAGIEAGLVGTASDRAGFLANARDLRLQPEECRRLGANGRRYAESRFQVDTVSAQFEIVFQNALRRSV